MNSERMLIDRFGRCHSYLRVSVTDRCNLRCVYCMPEAGIDLTPRDEVLTFEETARLCAIFTRNGVSKIRLTGGEPTVRKSIDSLMTQIARLEGVRELCMTTNGLTLKACAETYRNSGVSSLNISIDSLDQKRYAEITRRDTLSQALEGLDAALSAGFGSIKVNVVVMKGINEDEIPAFVDLATRLPIQVRFIEFMPFDQNGWDVSRVVPYAEMRATVKTCCNLRPISAGPNAVAKAFWIEGGQGSIGFVTSMTDNFCGGCNRLRLTADGHMKNCLFSICETNLRDPMRAGATDDELLTLIRQNLSEKWEGHPGMVNLDKLQNRSMIRIGG